MRRLLVRFRLAALNGVEIGFRHESTGKLAFMGIQGERQMKTTVFITRRGRSLAIARVNPTSAFLRMGEFQSGQMGQTVNLLSLDFGGSNPSSPTRQAYGDAGKPVPAVLPRNHLII